LLWNHACLFASLCGGPLPVRLWASNAAWGDGGTWLLVSMLSLKKDDEKGSAVLHGPFRTVLYSDGYKGNEVGQQPVNTHGGYAPGRTLWCCCSGLKFTSDSDNGVNIGGRQSSDKESKQVGQRRGGHVDIGMWTADVWRAFVEVVLERGERGESGHHTLGVQTQSIPISVEEN